MGRRRILGNNVLTLNLLRAGIVREAVATDISPGMLRALETERPAPARARDHAGRRRRGAPLRERVLRPRLRPRRPAPPARPAAGLPRVRPRPAARRHARLRRRAEPRRRPPRGGPKRAAWSAAPVWRSALRVREAASPGGHGDADPSLERHVDVHAFVPGELAGFARGAGLEDVRVRGEELLANWFGWANRTLEASGEPADIPWGWIQYAYRGYLLLQQVDTKLLEPRLPPALFYNLMIAARGDSRSARRSTRRPPSGAPGRRGARGAARTTR